MAEPVYRDTIAQGAFLAALATAEVGGSISGAARAAGISRENHYAWLHHDPTYPERFAEAKRQASSALEDEAIRRAMHGTRRYKFRPNGEPVLHPETGQPYYENEYSDQLLIMLLRAADPARFSNKVQLAGHDGGPLQHHVQMIRQAIEEVRDDPNYARVRRAEILAGRRGGESGAASRNGKHGPLANGSSSCPG